MVSLIIFSLVLGMELRVFYMLEFFEIGRE